MLNFYKKIFFVGLFFPFCVIAFAQNAKDELIKINKSFFQLNKFEVDVMFNTYVDNVKSKSEQSESCKMIRNDVNFYYRQKNYEVVKSGDYSISIDHRNKIMSVNHSKRNSSKQSKMPDAWNIIDSLFNLYESVSVQQINNSKNKITFTFKTGKLKKCDVFYDSQSYLIESIVSEYRNKIELEDKKFHSIKTEVIYSNFSKSIKNENKYFGIENYISQKSNKVFINNRYDEYQLISN